MRTRTIPFALTALALAGPALGGEPWAAGDPEAELKPAEQAAIAEALSPSLVRIECTLRTDKGEEPRVHGWAKRCPTCGRFHSLSVGRFIEQERPLAIEAFLLTPTRVVIPDVAIHPRFVEKVEAVYGDDRVGAKPAAFARDRDALFLELARPLAGTRPLAFDATRGPPYWQVSYDELGGEWKMVVQPFSTKTSVVPGRRQEVLLETNVLVVDAEGVPVALPMRADHALEETWKGSPLDWPAMEASEEEAFRERVRRVAEGGVLRVQLGFRSPKKERSARVTFMERESPTEQNVLGVLVGPKRVLLLANLAPDVTARLERIRVFLPDGRAVAATFKHTLRDYGALLAALEGPLEGAVDLVEGDVLPLRRKLMMGAEVRLQGEVRTACCLRQRIAGFRLGWREHLYPQTAGPDEQLFLFDERGRLVAFPLVRRVRGGEDRSWTGEGPDWTAAAQVAPLLADPVAHADPNNVPLSEQEENRVAWMGVLLQRLDRELARANQVSHLTRDGQTGALVSHVYPGSPADEAGVEPGWVLLRLHVEGYPKPIEVRPERDRLADWEFPWDRLDELPEQLYDRLPAPWPPVENTFTRMLTEIGFGKSYRAEMAHDGEVVYKEFTVVPSPPHFGMAAKFESEALGLTVKSMTFEARRYLQKTPEDPGVIVAEVEPGSKASVAGVKPFELVTHVNERPVHTVEDFEKAIAGQAELRLSVKRRLTGRVVKLNVDSP